MPGSSRSGAARGRPSSREAWGGEAVASAEAVVGHPDVDLVIVTTPNSSHPRVRPADARGRPPPGGRAADRGHRRGRGRPSRASPRERGLLFTTLQTGRNVAAAQAARRALDAGSIGQVRMAQLHWTGTSYPVDPSNWRAQPEHGGLFLDVGEHAFDLLAWLVGAEIERVHARVTDFAGTGPRGERHGAGGIRERRARPGLDLVRDPVAGPAEDRVPGAPRRRDAASSTSTRTARHGCAAPRSSAARRRRTWSSTDYGHADLGTGDRWERLVDEQPSDSSAVAVSDLRRIGKFIAHLREIVDGLLGRGPWPTEGHDGVRAIAAVEACRRSSESGRPEPVTALPTHLRVAFGAHVASAASAASRRAARHRGGRDGSLRRREAVPRLGAHGRAGPRTAQPGPAPAVRADPRAASRVDPVRLRGPRPDGPVPAGHVAGGPLDAAALPDGHARPRRQPAPARRRARRPHRHRDRPARRGGGRARVGRAAQLAARSVRGAPSRRGVRSGRRPTRGRSGPDRDGRVLGGRGDRADRRRRSADRRPSAVDQCVRRVRGRGDVAGRVGDTAHGRRAARSDRGRWATSRARCSCAPSSGWHRPRPTANASAGWSSR